MVFEHNGLYWISSASTGWVGTVLDLSNWQTKNGTKIITWVLTGGDNQIWQASKESHGFRLSPVYQESESHTLAALHQSSEFGTVIWSFNAGLNQQWEAIRVPNGDGAVFIKNMKNGMYLRSTGHGEQVGCAQPILEDRNFWWKLIDAHI